MASPTKIPAGRLQIRQGTLVLSFPMLPPISGTLVDLNEQGCRGAFALHELAPAMLADWQKALAPNRPLHLRLEAPPYLADFEIDGLVSTVTTAGGRTEVDLKFHHTAPAHRNILMQAVMTLATERVRQAGAQRLSAAQLPAGARPNPMSVPPPPPPSGSGSSAAVPAAPGSGAGHYSVPVAGRNGGPAQDVPPPPVTAPPMARQSPPRRQFSPIPEPMPPIVPPPPPPSTANAPAVPQLPPEPDDEPESKILDNPQLARAAATMPTHGAVVSSTQDTQTLRLKKVGEVLVHMGRLNNEQVSIALQQARANGERLGRYLLRTGLVTPDALCRALALQTGLPMTDLSDATIPDNLARVFPHELMTQYSFVPFDDSKAFVCIAVADPLPQTTTRELEKLCGKRIEMFLGQEDLVIRMLDKVRGKQKRKLRRFIRYEISALARYQFCSRLGHPAEEVIHHGTTLNISEGGFLIEGTPTALGSPDDLRRRGICARVVLTGTFQEITALCHLRSIRAKERAEAGKARWLLGLEVAEISADDRRRLKELCLKAVAERVRESE